VSTTAPSRVSARINKLSTPETLSAPTTSLERDGEDDSEYTENKRLKQKERSRAQDRNERDRKRKRADDGGDDRDDGGREEQLLKGKGKQSNAEPDESREKKKARKDNVGADEGKEEGMQTKKKTERPAKTSKDSTKTGGGREESKEEKVKKQKKPTVAASNVATSSRIGPPKPVPSVSCGTKRGRDNEDVPESDDERQSKKLASGGFAEHTVDSPWSSKERMQVAAEMMPTVALLCEKEWDSFCAKPHIMSMLAGAEAGLWHALCIFWQRSPGIRSELDNALKRAVSRVFKAKA
jgi:hypothetical protein